MRRIGINGVSCFCSLLWIIMVVMGQCLAGGPQRFATQPSDQTAVLGSTAVLPCRVIDKQGMVQWTRDAFGLGTVRILQGFERYSMIGSDEEGDFSLRISPVKLEDDAEYQCQASSPSGPPLRSRVARLTVFAPPQPPVISAGSEITVKAHSNITLTCKSMGGKPAPEIQWLDDSAGLEFRDGLAYREEYMDDQKRVKSESNLTFSPTRMHHNRTLTCLTHNPALNEPLSAKILLKVEYPPSVELQISPNELSEGMEAKATCVADANPSDVTYRWYRNGKEVTGATGSILNLGLLTRTDHDASLACEAANSAGEVRKYRRINLQYAPRFSKAPASNSAEIGDEVVLKCRVEANPEPEITWYFQKNSMIVGRGSELTITASPSTAGSYLCIARSGKYSPLEGKVNLRIRGPPVITSPKVVATRSGQSAILKCSVTSVPHPLAVTWSRNGDTINPGSEKHIALNEEQLADGIISTLGINHTQDKDFAPYKCTVINDYGQAASEILLQRQPIIPMVILVGGAAGVVLVVISVILFIVCHNRLKPTKNEKSIEAGNCTKNGMGREAPAILKSDVTNILTSAIPRQDIRVSDNDSDIKEPDNRTGSSLSAADRDSDHWEGSDKVIRNHTLTQTRYNHPVHGPSEQAYLGYADYTRDYSPVHIGDTYSQFKLGGPFARSSPATEQPGSLPSSVAPPPYSPTPNGLPGVNGSINGLASRNVRSTSLLNNALRHDLIADLQQPDLTREVARRQDMGLQEPNISDPSAMHTKYILPPQANMKPGTLV